MAEKIEMLTSAKIAENLGIPPKQIKKIIEEMKIEADQKKGACCYYSPSTVAKIKSSII
jgi:hypothetical protein